VYPVRVFHGAESPPPATQFVARQPIFNRDERVFGYELLFRDGLENCCPSVDVDIACRITLDSSLLMGLDVLCGGGYTFINCTRDVLLRGHAAVLPPRSTVVEVLETVEPASEIREACQRLKEAGYLVALDDFVPNDPRETLVDLADIIKLDLPGTPRSEWQKMAKHYGSRHIRMLAETVETREDFLATHAMGFVLFQGCFFQKPVILSATEVPHDQLNYVRMLQAVHRPELDFGFLERLIKQEASLCYRLLRYLNSAAVSFVKEIRSIRHALSILGEREIRRWISLVATVRAGRCRPGELVHSALVRAHFCELASRNLRRDDSDYFLLGLLSLLHAILGMPMAELLQRLPVDREIKAALLGSPSRLRPLYDLVLAQEKGDWKKCATLAVQLRLPESDIAKAYLESVRWAREVAAL